MNTRWAALVALFALSLGLITGGIIKGAYELVLAGVGIGIFLYVTRNYFK
ncbi:MAG: hypothetical protein MK369_03615 [SAR202 cluster bacterium]|jgi:hypothetical protein|nr:hypothetical protein [SAR202 cluster bacterium]MEC7884976.1 hypothetical protein [Chloroflexota bacterium]